MRNILSSHPCACCPSTRPPSTQAFAAAVLGAVGLLASPISLGADATAPRRTEAPAATLVLREAFTFAWKHQPEARSVAAREDAARARRDIAGGWTAEPVAVEVTTKTDRLNRNDGSREHELGLSIPLWLPGERSGTRALADAEAATVATRLAAARLRTSAMVREAYWSWQRARIEFALAHDRLANAEALAADVTRRHRAGDLARSDQHQADGNVAAAQSVLAESNGALIAATQALRALIGQPIPDVAVSKAGAASGDSSELAEPLPAVPKDLGALDANHPAVADLLAQAEVAKRAIGLARLQTRANPEVLVATARDRGTFGDPYSQTITVGVRFPLGSDARSRLKIAQASAESIEIESQLGLERERLLAGLDAARQKVDTARAQRDASRKRARLAVETRGFFDKSFRAGETDLPTRLRIELEAAEAERQAARAEVEHASAISALRQALGLLPE